MKATLPLHVCIIIAIIIIVTSTTTSVSLSIGKSEILTERYRTDKQRPGSHGQEATWSREGEAAAGEAERAYAITRHRLLPHLPPPPHHHLLLLLLPASA